MSFYPPGTRIADRYLVTGRPFMGGMGVVYLCHDLQDDRPVALKTFRPEYLSDRAARDRFLREGTRWVELGSHPHIVRCYEVIIAKVGDEVYLVLELVVKQSGRDDASLRAWLAPGVPLPVEQALVFALQIVRGMQHAVKTISGFVHRDLKPENVLVGADSLPGEVDMNRLRVTDFGLASVMQFSGTQAIGGLEVDQASGTLGRTQLTQGVVGTPLYMAPEQWRGEEPTVATDIYAVGCILYEMVTGHRAVEGDSLASLRQAHCEGRQGSLPGGRATTASEVLARSLAVHPGERYQSWEAVETALGVAYELVAGRQAPVPARAGAVSSEERAAAGWSFSAIGWSYLELGRADVACQYFERAMVVAEAEKERYLAASTLGNLGEACRLVGRVRDAIGYHEQALAIVRELGKRRDEGIALGTLGNAFADLSDTRRAIGCYEQMLAIGQELPDQSLEGAALGNLGAVYASLGDAWRAVDYLEHALSIHHQGRNRHHEAAVLSGLGEIHRRLGNTKRAIGYVERALSISREIGDLREEGNALCNLGAIYQIVGNGGYAISYLEKALTIGREIGNRQLEATALCQLGRCYRDLGQRDMAVSFFQHAVTIFHEIGDQGAEAWVSGDLGTCYRGMGRLAEALEALNRALQVHRDLGDRRGEGNDLGNLGNCYFELGEIDQAFRYHQLALEIATEVGDTQGCAAGCIMLAQIVMRQGHHTQALRYAERAAQASAQMGNLQYTQTAETLIARIRRGKGAFGDPVPAEIIQHFAPVVAIVVAAARGDGQARAAMEAVFGQLKQGGGPIVRPIRRILAGERDESDLIVGLEKSDILIVREILKQLKN